MVSCAGILTFVFLAGGCILAVISLGTHHWVDNNDTGKSIGLWEVCGTNSSDNNSKYCISNVGTDVGDWFLAVEIAYSSFVILIISSMLEFLLHLCCSARCTGVCCITLSAIDLMLGLVCSVGSLVLFGVKAHDGHSATFEGSIKFSWSFYLAMAAGAATLLSLIFVVCEIPKSRAQNARNRAQYQPIRPTD